MTDRPSDPAAWARLQEVCGSFPQVREKVSHGELAWSAGRGSRSRQFATTWDHHHDTRNGVVFAAAPGVQEALVGADQEHYFVPPYVGGRGWVGAYLDVPDVDWDRIELLVRDAYLYVTTP